jgi:hypothetical protein
MAITIKDPRVNRLIFSTNNNLRKNHIELYNQTCAVIDDVKQDIRILSGYVKTCPQRLQRDIDKLHSQRLLLHRLKYRRDRLQEERKQIWGRFNQKLRRFVKDEEARIYVSTVQSCMENGGMRSEGTRYEMQYHWNSGARSNYYRPDPTRMAA